MECVICKNGTTNPGFASVVLQRDESTIIIKNVPADICENCGEYYLDDKITAHILEKAEASIKLGAEIEILKFVA